LVKGYLKKDKVTTEREERNLSEKILRKRKKGFIGILREDKVVSVVV